MRRIYLSSQFILIVLLGLASVARAGPFEAAAQLVEEQIGGLERQIEMLDATIASMTGEIAALRARIDGEDPRFDQTPLVPHNIPGRIEAEDFDLGGEGVAYHDATAGNVKGDYRAEDVDIEVTADVDGRYNVGWVREGEWLEYTVDVLEGIYKIRLRVASVDGAAAAVRLTLDGTVLGVADLPATGAWQAWQTVTIPAIELAGSRAQVLRIEFRASQVNVNWVAFERTGDRAANRGPVDLLLLSEACAREVGAQIDWP